MWQIINSAKVAQCDETGKVALLIGDKVCPLGADGATSWNDLTDKPFYTVDDFQRIASGFYDTSAATLPTDGRWDFSFPLDLSLVNDRTYKVEIYIGLAKIAEQTHVAYVGTSMGMPSSRLGVYTDDVFLSNTGGIASWRCCFTYNDDPSIMGFNIYVYESAETVKPLDEKYLPESVATKVYVDEAVDSKQDTITGTEGQVAGFDSNGELVAVDHEYSWNDLTDKPFGEQLDFSTKVASLMGKFTFTEIVAGNGEFFAQSSDIALGKDFVAGKTYRVKISYMGTTVYCEFEGVATYNALMSQYTISDGHKNTLTKAHTYTNATIGISCVTDNTNIANSAMTSMTMVQIFEGNEAAIPLNEKYLPESVESVVVRSSTANSTKKFKITVDDSGTITATAV